MKRTIRTRLAVRYAAVVFVVMAAAVAVLFVACGIALGDAPIAGEVGVSGTVTVDDETVTLDAATPRDIAAIEEATADWALERLRGYLVVVLVALVPIVAIIGWFLARSALRPMNDIVRTANAIQPTDLNSRIARRGPDDELKLLADTIDRMLDRLQIAFEAQRRFIADASHELRSPVAVIRANVDLLDHSEPVVARLDRAASRLQRVVDDLLMLMTWQQPALRPVRVDLSDLAADVVDDHRRSASARNVTLQLAGVGTTVEVDVDGTARAIGNIVDNAVRYAPAGTQVSVTLDGGRIAVSDRGPGLESAQLERAFERFWRANPSEPDGTGLGLAIARDVVHAHGGSITVASVPGRGSTFTISLPVAGAVSSVRPVST